jgi:selenium metabolism protein YedF
MVSDAPMTESTKDGTVVVFHAETLGRGDDALGAKLMGSYLRTLVAVDAKPDALVFYNAAVKLLSEGSPHLEALRALHAAGVDVLACVTCLEHFALTSKMGIGTVSNMREIVQRTLAASKVVTV